MYVVIVLLQSTGSLQFAGALHSAATTVAALTATAATGAGAGAAGVDTEIAVCGNVVRTASAGRGGDRPPYPSAVVLFFLFFTATTTSTILGEL